MEYFDFIVVDKLEHIIFLIQLSLGRNLPLSLLNRLPHLLVIHQTILHLQYLVLLALFY